LHFDEFVVDYCYLFGGEVEEGPRDNTLNCQYSIDDLQFIVFISVLVIK